MGFKLAGGFAWAASPVAGAANCSHLRPLPLAGPPARSAFLASGPTKEGNRSSWRRRATFPTVNKKPSAATGAIWPSTGEAHFSAASQECRPANANANGAQRRRLVKTVVRGATDQISARVAGASEKRAASAPLSFHHRHHVALPANNDAGRPARMYRLPVAIVVCLPLTTMDQQLANFGCSFCCAGACNQWPLAQTSCQPAATVLLV